MAVAAHDPWPDVQRELLLALLGYPGEVFIEYGGAARPAGDAGRDDAASAAAHDSAAGGPAAPAAGFRLADDWRPDLVAERQVLSRLSQLGHCYRELARFAERARSHDPPGAPPRPRLYLAAMATGVDELLASFESTVLRLESAAIAAESSADAAEWARVRDSPDATRGIPSGASPTGAEAAGGLTPGANFGPRAGCGPGLPLATLTDALCPFEPLLPAAARFVLGAEAAGLGGGELLSALAALATGGAAPAASAFGRLGRSAHVALWRQLAAWVVYGALLDPGGEFFIRRMTDDDSGIGPGLNTGAAGVTDTSGAAAAVASFHGGHGVRLASLPPCVSLPAAQAALFAGRATAVLRSPGTGYDASELLPPDAEAELVAQLAELAAWGESGEDESSRDDPFSASGPPACAVERCLTAVQASLAVRLWGLVSGRAKLGAHLMALKDYALLARGDFYHALLEEAAPLFAAPPGPGAAAGLAAAAAAAAAASTAGGDPLYPHARLVLLPHATSSTTDSAGSRARVDGWAGLTLVYDAPWPLGLLLTPAALASYGALFRHLMRLRRLTGALEASWVSRRRAAAASGGGSGLWRLRASAAHLVTNLQVYLQVDVIEAQHAALMARVGAAADFRDAASAHAAFLSAVASQAFLDLPAVAKILDAALDVAGDVAAALARESIITDSVNDSVNDSKSDAEALTLGAALARSSARLYTVLSGNRLAGSARALFLRQLLLRLNFNGHLHAQALQLLGGGEGGAGGGRG